jgi:hypothetical protein
VLRLVPCFVCLLPGLLFVLVESQVDANVIECHSEGIRFYFGREEANGFIFGFRKYFVRALFFIGVDTVMIYILLSLLVS